MTRDSFSDCLKGSGDQIVCSNYLKFYLFLRKPLCQGRIINDRRFMPFGMGREVKESGLEWQI